MIRYFLARKAGIERMSAFIIVIVGSMAILMLSFPSGYKLHAVAWIALVAGLGWFGHWFSAS